MESQSPPGVASVRWHEMQHDILVYQLQKEDEGRCGPASKYGRGPGDGDTEEEEVANAAFALTSLVRFAFRNPKP